MTNHFFNILLSLSLIFIPSLSFAFKLVPMVTQFSPSGNGKSQVFKITNNGQNRIAIQLSMTTREISLDGAESRNPVNEFTIYPEQISLAPNDSRNIRVTYKGEADVKTEKSYRLIAKQLPVEFGQASQQNQLKFLFEYVASVYVTPTDSFPKLEVTKKEVSGNSIIVRIKNTGTAHQLLKDIAFSLKVKNENIEPSKEEQEAWDATNLLAGAEREYKIKTKSNFGSQAPVSFEISNKVITN